MEKRMVEIKGVRIGEGMPKICVPLTDTTIEGLLKSADAVVESGLADLVEWRLDWFLAAKESSLLPEAARRLRSRLGDLPLLATIRTACEGGELSLPPEEYRKLNLWLAESGLVDLIDIQVFSSGCEEKTAGWIEELQKAGVKVIGSWHCFEETPPQESMEWRLHEIQKRGADICKMAVMPKHPADVFRLLRATRQANEYLDRPLVTMSMSGLGAASRLTGEYTGSALTFGTLGTASAPGQIPAGELKQLLTALHEKRKLVLIGFMGSGKSTQGAALAEGLGCPLYDTDQMIEEVEGMSVQELFVRKGEPYFRQQEANVLKKLTKLRGLAVISTGGGMAVSEDNHPPMRELGLVVCLNIQKEEVMRRLKGDKSRPLLAGANPEEKIEELLKFRAPFYEKAADVMLFL